MTNQEIIQHHIALERSKMEISNEKIERLNENLDYWDRIQELKRKRELGLPEGPGFDKKLQEKVDRYVAKKKAECPYYNWLMDPQAPVPDGYEEDNVRGGLVSKL